MKIAIIGTGYVGTVTGTCLAELGHQVVCSDVNEERIGLLSQGVVPFYEPGLEPILRSNMEEGRLTFTSDNKEATKEADVVFLCIGTPPLPSGKPDLRPLEQAIREIATALRGYTLIVEKSTLPVRTGEWLRQMLEENISSKDATFDMAAVPQFLREGHAMNDFMKPDRVVLGSTSQRAISILVDIYRPLHSPLLITDMNSAELIKHASNAFLAMKISFINSIASICERTGADITQVAPGIGLDKRISPEFLNAGVGYGGIFFAKDLQSLVTIADEYSINLDLIKSVEVINRYQRITFVEKVEDAVGGSVKGKTVGIWGLAYRPNTDDMRDAPSLNIIRSLEKRGAKIKAYDPLAMEATRKIIPQIEYCNSPYEAATDVDAILIITEWKEFEQINFRKLKADTKCRLIIDGRNIYHRNRMQEQGFTYISIGRQPVLPKAPSPEGVAEKKPVKAG